MDSPPIPSTTSTDELLRHAAWVRRVARALVSGADRVDDLQQETWLAALASPPRSAGDLRRWLSAVTRNVARRLFRSESTRRRHEVGAIASSTSPAAEAIVARAEIQQRVASAVLALDEPYRSTLLARYYDELPPTEIARVLGISVETVKTRLKRGLARLREELESQRGGAPTLEALLAPLCVPIATPLLPVSAKIAAMATLLVVGVSLSILIPMTLPRSGGNPENPQVAPTAVAAVQETASSSAVPDASRSITHPVDDATKSEPAAPRDKSTLLTADLDQSARLTGRLLLPDGNPAWGVSLHLKGWVSDPDRGMRFGNLPRMDLQCVSDATGEFNLEFKAPRAFDFALEAKLAGFAALQWRWREIEPGTSKQLGDTTLQRGATIRGRIVDRGGLALNLTSWELYCDGPKCASGDGAEETTVTAKVDAGAPGFTLEDIAPGTAQLKAHSDLAGWINGPKIEVQSNIESRVDIIYEGPDLARLISVSLQSWPHEIFYRYPPKLYLTGVGVENRREKQRMGDCDCYFDDLPAGQYSVEMSDARFLPWRQEGIVPGTALTLELVGSAELRLRVIDADTNAHVDHYSLRVRLEGSGSLPYETVEIQSESESPPTDGMFRGIVAMEQTLSVRAAGFAPWIQRMQRIPPKQITEITVPLSKGATLRGVVRESGGKTPAKKTRVHLEPRAAESTAETLKKMFSGGAVTDSSTTFLDLEPDTTRDERDTLTDANGSFSFSMVGTGTYTLRAGEEPTAVAIEDIAVDADTKTVDGLDLVLPGRGALVGRLLGPPGADFSGLRVVAIQSDATQEEDPSDEPDLFDLLGISEEDGMTGVADVARDGSFRIGALPVGRHELMLKLPDFEFTLEGQVPFDRAGPNVELGAVSIVDREESRVEFDLRDSMPGRLQVSVLGNQHAPVGALVEIVREFEEGASIKKKRGDGRVASARLGADGVVTVAAVPVGRVRVVVRAADSTWAYWSKEPIEVSAASEAHASMAFTLCDGDVLIKDCKSGVPCASQNLEIGARVRSGMDYVVRVKTDERGIAHLRLAPGQYWIRVIATEPRAAKAFEWTQSGAVEGSLSIDPGD